MTERVRVPFAPPGFDLLRKLGSGGMGDVYLVREQVSERTVAMKFLRSPGNSAALDRFIDEIRALARINHPNIVRFYWEDYNRDRPFFTMEYAAGGSLADRVSASGPLPPLEAAELIATAARAVHAAHTVNVLHRDLKPSNVLLAADGSVKVSDFSLAKLTDRDDENTGAELLGTPGFMPPEQIARDRGPVGASSDVYGLGATLYYLLTGRAPFVGENKMDIVAQVERELPDRPRRLRPEIPMALEAVTLKCLEKNPANRYSNAAELADELDRFRAGLGTKVLPLTPLRRARRWVVWNRKAIGLAVLAVALAAGLFAVGRQFRKIPTVLLDPEQVIHKEIPAGPTPLLTAGGRPRSEIRALGSLDVSGGQEDGGTCTIESRGAGALFLLKDPGFDTYRLRAEICQRLKLAKVAGNHPDTSEVGLTIGYADQDGPDDGHVHSMLILQVHRVRQGGRARDQSLGSNS